MTTGRSTEDGFQRRNIVLTGPARSGTTLACWLLNKVPNTLALVEPIRPFGFVDPKADPETIAGAMQRFFGRQRRMAQERGIVQSKNVAGIVPSDPYASERSEGEGLRYQRAREGTELGDVRVDGKHLGPGYWLVVKDPATLSALLPALVERFPCYAIIRNPLAILASWNSVNHAARDGHSPVAERYDEDLREELAAIPERRARQLRLLDWWFSRFRDFLPDHQVIRYESIVGTGGSALSAVVPNAGLLGEPLDSRNVNPLYDRGVIRDLSERLLESDGAFWSFYRRREVEDLVRRITMKATPYERGYADAAVGREPHTLVGPEDGISSLRDEVDYYAGYTDALDDLQEGYYDPAEVALERGWTQDLSPSGGRREVSGP